MLMLKPFALAPNPDLTQKLYLWLYSCRRNANPIGASRIAYYSYALRFLFRFRVTFPHFRGLLG